MNKIVLAALAIVTFARVSASEDLNLEAINKDAIKAYVSQYPTAQAGFLALRNKLAQQTLPEEKHKDIINLIEETEKECTVVETTQQ